MARIRRPISERFEAKVDQSGGPNACWPWTGAVAGGYGRLFVGVGVSPVGASRLAWELTNGPIPEGLSVCHRCDNPPCCNPEHLFLGTSRENVQDAKSKGRTRNHGGYPGDSNPNHKLTWEQVREIRRLRADGLTQQRIADQFGIGQARVSEIVRGETWEDR